MHFLNVNSRSICLRLELKKKTVEQNRDRRAGVLTENKMREGIACW